MKLKNNISSAFIVFFLLTIYSGAFTQFNNNLSFNNYNVNNGLSYNFVDCIFQDHKGWIWIGTGTDIERFDGVKFKKYGVFFNDTIERRSLIVRDFYQTANNDLIVCLEKNGLAYYNRELDRFESVLYRNTGFKSVFAAKDIKEDSNGNLWIATKQGLWLYNPDNQTIKKYTATEKPGYSLSSNYVRKVELDPSGKIWVGTLLGLDYLDPLTGKVIQFSKRNALLGNDIYEILLGKNNQKCIGTEKNGIIIIDSANTTFNQAIPDKNDERSYKIKSIHRTKDGIYWIGSRGGLYLFDENNKTFSHYQASRIVDNSLIHNSIEDIFEDDKGDIWIGTRGGLSHLSQQKQGFHHYQSIPNNNKFLNDYEIYCIWEDPDGNIWTGTEKGGVNIYNKLTGNYEYLTKENQGGLNSNCIKSIKPLDNERVLIGTYQGGLTIYNRKTKNSVQLKHDPLNKKSISSNNVWCTLEDNSGNIWVGTSAGLDLFNKDDYSFIHIDDFENSQRFLWIYVDTENDLWLGASEVLIYRPGVGIVDTFNLDSRSMYEDSKNRFWITTIDKGIALCDKKDGILKYYSKSDGIASNMTFRIEEDSKGNLWISTGNGLSYFNIDEESFSNYTMKDGLQSNQFYYGASYKNSSGELFFGGINGLTVFKPKEITKNIHKPPVFITDLKIFNKSVTINSTDNSVLHKSISETKVLRLPYKSKVLTFDYTALNYTNSINNKFKYKLEGFDDKWIGPTQSRSVTYTNLSPGEYTFKVQGSNNDDVWNEEGASLELIISAPVYMTIWFKILLVILIIVSLVFIIKFILNKRDLQKKLEFETERAKNLHDLDEFKLKFFTNVSHEIKTPLTLITSPIKKLSGLKNVSDEVKESIELIERNAQHLLKLVSQLLDYRKLQEGKLTIELKKGDIVRFSKSVFLSFKDLMIEKNIQYSFTSVQDKIMTSFDESKLKIILNNLLSNAIKYNKKSGSIDMLMHLVVESKHKTATGYNRYIQIVIKDSGIGINRKDLQGIFTRFYSGSHSAEIKSTGLGLTYAKELLELHNGKIEVKSEEGKGSVFSIMLPLIDDGDNTTTIIQNNKTVEKDTMVYIHSPEFEEEQKHKKVILLIDDNKDILTFLISHFKDQYIVLTADDGAEGLEIGFETIPDLIITDVMMPEVGGLELCDRIKKDEKTSHIPIIMLTALSSEKNVLKGLEIGADDYMTKPFDIAVLNTKVKNMLLLSDKLKEKYASEMVLMPTNKKVDSPDKIFLNKILSEIESELDNPNLDIENLAKKLGVSRMQLYRKVAALTHMTVRELINDIRLKRALQIMEQHKMNVSEIAYSVGFSDTSYFGKCFKKKYGASPSQYIKKLHLE